MNKKSTFRSVANNYLTHPKQDKAITLIALVITIIVLLILAGVTIATLTGNNGILTQAQNAKLESERSEYLEKIQLAVLAAQTNGNGTITEENLKNELKTVLGNDYNDNNFKSRTRRGETVFIYNDRKISKDGNITTYNKAEEEINLPSNFQQVEYIESTGTQYITMDFWLARNRKYKYGADFQVTTIDFVGDGFKTIMGSNMTAITYDAEGKYGGNLLGTQEHKVFVEIISDNNSVYRKIYIDGNEVNEEQTNYFYDRPITLFANNLPNDPRLGKVKIYRAQIYENDALLRDLIPCYRKSDNVIGMYDIIYNLFYTNSGTGTFLKGDNIE